MHLNALNARFFKRIFSIPQFGNIIKKDKKKVENKTRRYIDLIKFIRFSFYILNSFLHLLELNLTSKVNLASFLQGYENRKVVKPADFFC